MGLFAHVSPCTLVSHYYNGIMGVSADSVALLEADSISQSPRRRLLVSSLRLHGRLQAEPAWTALNDFGALLNSSRWLEKGVGEAEVDCFIEETCIHSTSSRVNDFGALQG